ncbi:MAG: hypothetical protein HFH53_07185 [Hespellia sp.]|nr:hypothetical protein [Hespellia sp.]
MTVYFVILSFFVYGFLGWCTEVGFAACKEKRFVNRGFLNGPICPIYGVGVTMVIQMLTPVKEHVLVLYIASVVLVTVLEGLTGYILDKIFHNKWWDYSNMPLNIGGYVCLLFSLIWGVACVAIVKLIHPLIFRGLVVLPKALGFCLIGVFGIVMFVDLYVTASGIIRMNRRLEYMERIAAELHEISDQLGEEIYKGVILALEKQEESRQKLDVAAQNLKEWGQEIAENTHSAAEEMSEKMQTAAEEMGERVQTAAEEMSERIRSAVEEMGERITSLREKYNVFDQKEVFITQRLMKAFPTMKSRRYKEALEELRVRLNRKQNKK